EPVSRAAAGRLPRHDALLGVRRELLRLEAGRAAVRVDGPVPRPQLYAQREWHRRSPDRRRRRSGILPRLARAAGARTHVPAGRRLAGTRSRRGAERWLLET